MEHYFIESREMVQMVAEQGKLRRAQREVDCGVGISRVQPGYHSYQWYPFAREAHTNASPPFSEGVYEIASAMHHPRTSQHFDQERTSEILLQAEAALQKAGIHAQVSIHFYDQDVAIGNSFDWQYDHRSFATLGVRVFAQAGEKERSIRRSYAYPSLQMLLEALPNLTDEGDALANTANATLHTVACPRGEMPVILSPGHAAVFFHEVCGHPLEGDIVVNRASYLASRSGDRVAEEYVTLVDDPSPALAKVAYRIDDEGTPARPVHLLKRGMIQEPLLDKRNAHLLGLEPNGHGRRLDFQHYAIPRMAHTQVLPHEGTLEEALDGVQQGILVSQLKLRQMNLLSGDFSFILTEARLIHNGNIGAYISNGLISGNGLQCLREIDFVGADDARFLNAGGGCGKLDQWPLVVSFGQPTVRFRRLRVDPW